MAKQKNTELNFLYMDEQYNQSNNKKKTKNEAKNKGKKEGAENKKAASTNKTFNFDNEIIIGVTKLPEKNAKTKSKKALKNNNRKINKNKELSNTYQNDKRLTKKEIKELKKKRKKQEENNKRNLKNNDNIEGQKNNKKSRIIKKVIKWFFLLSALIAAFIFFMMSPLFNLVQVQVVNNEKINTETIISLSKLTMGDNIYKTSSKQIEKNIKQNAYIESADIKRQLPNKILIKVKERKTTYMLEYASSFVYINNQGYILEISEEKLELPIITGYTTKQEEIKVGSRLNNDDLEKLSTVLKIVESANANGISNLITKINIQNKQNYILALENEKKTVYIGDATNLSNRMLYLKAVLEEEKGVEGEVFINGDLNKQDVYFRIK